MADQSRPTRAETVRQERRRKPGSVMATGLKLALDETKLDRNTYEYRWANDKGNRIAQMKDNDWDVVSETAKDDADGVGSVQNKVVGTDAGKPIQGVLMRKRKDWFEADKKEKQKPLDETDEAIRRGVNHTKELPGDVSYTPGGRNTIGRA